MCHCFLNRILKMSYSLFFWWRGHGINPHLGYLQIKPEKSATIGTYVYEFISAKVPVLLFRVFRSVQGADK